MMKKIRLFASLLVVLLSVLFLNTGCTFNMDSGISDSLKNTEISTESVTAAVETTVSSSAMYDENTIGTAEVSTNNSATGTTEVTTVVPAEAWETKANQVYDAACDMYFGIVFNGGYFQEMGIQVVHSI